MPCWVVAQTIGPNTLRRTDMAECVSGRSIGRSCQLITARNSMTQRKKAHKGSRSTTRSRTAPAPPKDKESHALVVAAWIAAGAAVLAAIVGPVAAFIVNRVSPASGQSATNTPRSGNPFSIQGDFDSALAEIRSGRTNLTDQGMMDLGIVYIMANQAMRYRILTILALYVSQHAPPMPSADNTFAYCLMRSPPRLPLALYEALRIIGNRNPNDVGRRIDLSDVNLAYSVLDGLNLTNVNFDNDLLCRTIFFGSTFKGTSFVGADLRFSIIKEASGLQVGQLRVAYSLYKAQLPKTVAANDDIADLVIKILTSGANP